ncbi:PspC domain-containing protein [Pedobacter metabolipauper]|uniref:Phage shock protein C (PspC) family protein n=1 Tax=Pedobacter metabolipauper TaxID=425513 RepID=A0A4R6ST00_9SPHI|nr:PspC domain-containing protein [Pedobacter metabolipauper]TDQ07698.1 phage shock protein C (PspC) family protein [Pedobacter metabolipauper]
MKKTLNINIGNTIIHIEEDAYELLTVYLNEVKFHFSKNADNFEIVTDIENRIAEMFSEILAAQQKQAISIEDVQSIIEQMGSVKDFETSEEAEEDQYTGPSFNPIKKLYRDTDKANIAGVCVGLAHYMDVSVSWVRLAFLVSAGFGGAGILAYLILWIMIPKAGTKTEKMFMRGEEANLRGFANSYLHPFVDESRGFIARSFDALGRFIHGTGKIIFKILAVFIIAVGSFTLISLFITLIAILGVWDASLYHQFPFNIINEEYFTTLAFAAFVTCAVPLLALVLFTVRVAFSSRPVNKTFSFVLLIIWLFGMGSSIFYAVKISSDFKESAEFSQTVELKPYQAYTLNIDRTRFFTSADSLRYQIDPNRYKGRKILTDRDWNNNEQPRNIRLTMVKSEDNSVSMTQNYSSRGRTFEDALKNAQNTHYDFAQKGAVLNFSSALQILQNVNWRDQELEMILKVPVGTSLTINKDLNRSLNGYNYWCDHDDNSDYTEWIMTDTGLKCKYPHEEKEEE